MQTVDYVLPSDNLLRSLPDFAYLDLMPGMPKLRHIGLKTFVRLRRFNPPKRGDFRTLRLAGFVNPGERYRPTTKPCRVLDGPERSPLWLYRFDWISITNHPSTRFACSRQASLLSLFTFD